MSCYENPHGYGGRQTAEIARHNDEDQILVALQEGDSLGKELGDTGQALDEGDTAGSDNQCSLEHWNREAGRYQSPS